MQYFEMIPDLFDSGIRFGDGSYVSPASIGLDDDLCKKLHKWNNDYKKYINPSIFDWILRKREMSNLDSVGIDISNEISRIINTEVRYYSPLLERHISQHPSPSDYKIHFL